jgi:hypothetical protein
MLRTSCRNFDEGLRDEAIRMAATMRVLLRDGPRSTSLLKHLKAKDIRLVSTVPEQRNMDGMIFFDSLTTHGPHGPQPTFDEWPQRPVSVAEWLNQVVYVASGERITRNDLILTAANKDGGAHVDRKLPRKYEELTSGFIFTSSADDPQVLVPIEEIHLIGLRQLAHELFRSPDLMDLARKAEAAIKPRESAGDAKT